MTGSMPGNQQVMGAMPKGMTAAVTGSDDKLQAFDPATMAGTVVPPSTPGPGFTAAGMTSSGIPEWMSNWLAQGGQGTPPTAPGGAATATVDPSALIAGTAGPGKTQSYRPAFRGAFGPSRWNQRQFDLAKQKLLEEQKYAGLIQPTYSGRPGGL